MIDSNTSFDIGSLAASASITFHEVSPIAFSVSSLNFLMFTLCWPTSWPYATAFLWTISDSAIEAA